MGRKPPIEINGLWLRRIGDQVQVLVQINGRWRIVMEEQFDSEFSRVVEPGGIAKSKLAQRDSIR